MSLRVKDKGYLFIHLVYIKKNLGKKIVLILFSLLSSIYFHYELSRFGLATSGLCKPNKKKYIILCVIII